MLRFHALLLAIASCITAQAGITIDNKVYQADTLRHRTVGPGMVNTIVRLPDYPLNVYILEADMTNPHMRVETTMAYNTVGQTEPLANAYTRNRTATRRPVAGCNANFWVVTGTGAPMNQYQLGTPMGAVVRNDTTYTNTNMTTDKWDGGWSRTGASVITHEGVVRMGHWAWGGFINHPQTGTLNFTNVNRRCVKNDIALWNKAYGPDREFETNWTSTTAQGNNSTDNYYLQLKSGEQWKVNSTMTFVVKKIVKGADRQTLGEYDACLTASGTSKTKMSKIAVGNEVAIACNWSSEDCNMSGGTAIMPTIENMVEGNAQVMHDGQLTGRNYDEEYNSMIYSRTAYGCNADGTRLYMIVIDKSLSKEYGQSAGCSTATMCQILKSMCPDVSEVINYDAGGSAQMMVGGTIINTTTEGTPRPVATGWLLTAVGNEDSEVASIQFEDYRIQAPVHSSFVPRILGYNRNGELVDEDVQGFELSCAGSVGRTEGNVFIAGGEAVNGTLTATLGNMTCSVPVTTMAAQPSIAIKPTILIDTRDYPVDVTATVQGNTYFYDPAHLQWSIADQAVATIDHGTLAGVRNGDTRLTCSVGNLTDETDVKVEISNAPVIGQEWNGWSLKQSGASNLELKPDGTLEFDYTGGRAPYIALHKDITFYSLPDTIAFTFNSTIPIEYVQVDTRNNAFTSLHYVKYETDSVFAAGMDHTVTIDLASMGGADNVSTYPISTREIRFTPAKGSDTGLQHITMKNFHSHYSRYSRNVKGDVNGDGEVDVYDINLLVNYILTGTATPQADVNGDGTVDVADANQVTNIILGIQQ